MTNTVLFYSRDPGGTNQLIALHAQIETTPSDQHTIRNFIADVFDINTKVVIAAKDSAVNFWHNAGVEVEDWSNLDINACISRMNEHSPSHLITATTDIDDRTDLALWQAARAQGIRSTAFTDHKINLIRRFFDQDQKIVHPDCIFVLDEDCRDILVSGGLAKECVKVGGDLHIDWLKKRANEETPERHTLRTQWSVSADETVVLFLSENTREMSAAGRPGNYDEFECLEYVIHELAKPRTDLGGRSPFEISQATIVIRPHPKDTPGKYASYAQDRNPRVLISNKGDGTTAVAAAELVVGMRSSLFAEAAVLNVPVVSLVDGGGQ